MAEVEPCLFLIGLAAENCPKLLGGSCVMLLSKLAGSQGAMRLPVCRIDPEGSAEDRRGLLAHPKVQIINSQE